MPETDSNNNTNELKHETPSNAKQSESAPADADDTVGKDGLRSIYDKQTSKGTVTIFENAEKSMAFMVGFADWTIIPWQQNRQVSYEKQPACSKIPSNM